MRSSNRYGAVGRRAAELADAAAVARAAGDGDAAEAAVKRIVPPGPVVGTVYLTPGCIPASWTCTAVDRCSSTFGPPRTRASTLALRSIPGNVTPRYTTRPRGR